MYEMRLDAGLTAVARDEVTQSVTVEHYDKVDTIQFKAMASELVNTADKLGYRLYVSNASSCLSICKDDDHQVFSSINSRMSNTTRALLYLLRI